MPSPRAPATRSARRASPLTRDWGRSVTTEGPRGLMLFERSAPPGTQGPREPAASGPTSGESPDLKANVATSAAMSSSPASRAW